MTTQPPKTLYLGSAYYPEHWPESRWAEDIRLMQEAGLNVARLGEFAWSTMEPADGQFQFDWLARAIDQLAQAGIDTVLGTPTAAPPAWLTQARPDTLAVDEYGRRAQHGNRCHFCVNSATYQGYCRRIVAAMGERFGHHPHVIGWQLDNEYNRVCYCEECRSQFQTFLQARYGSLDELNARWATAYWSQTYTDWTQIPAPIGGHNPGLMLDWKRFITESYRQYQQVQIDALRPQLREGVWITHNFMGWFDGFDHYALNEDLDMASWDYYVGTGHHDHLEKGAIHDLTRGFKLASGKPKNFWVMETQPGSVNWRPVNNVLNQGEARVMAWQAIGHGADGVLYWQWRSALNGQEQYHGSLVDQSGQPRPFYDEVKLLGADVLAVGELLAETRPEARVAFLNDYPSRWSIQWQKHHADFDWVKHLTHYYRPFARANLGIDVVHADTPLDNYRIVVMPALIMLNEQRSRRLTEFVRRGGKLIITARSAMKDEDNSLLPMRQPGTLADLAGVEVEEYYALDEPVPIKGNWFEGQSRIWAERLKVRDSNHVAVIAKYGPSNGWLDGQPAITVRGTSSGLCYYCGAYLDDEAQEAFLHRVIETVGLRAAIQVPEGVELCTRVTLDGKTRYFILINHTRAGQLINLPWPAAEQPGGRVLTGRIELPAYEVAVVTKA